MRLQSVCEEELLGAKGASVRGSFLARTGSIHSSTRVITIISDIIHPFFSSDIKLMKSPEESYFYLSSIYSTQCQNSIPAAIKCGCHCCSKPETEQGPSITLNPQIEQISNLKRLSKNPCVQSEWVQFLNLIELCHPKIPHIPILDTIVFKGGQPDYMLKFSRTLKLDRSSCREYQKVILERKRELDIEFLKREYTQNNPGFVFSSLDHIGEIIVRGFVDTIEEVIPEERRTSTLKLSSVPSPFIISEKQLSKNMNLQSNKRFREAEIEYIQVFPIPARHQESFRTLQLTFNREKAIHHPLWKEAEYYFSLWQKHSDTLHHSEQQYLKKISRKQDQMLYNLYKLIMHINSLTDIRVDSMIAEFYLDKFQNYYLKNVKDLCVKNLKELIESLRVPERVQEIKKEDYIVLDSKLGEYFEGFRQKLEWFRDIDKKNEEVENQDLQVSRDVIHLIKHQVKPSKILNKIIQ